MTSNHEQDAFEIQFESAVNEAHERSDRGVSPSGNVWKSIRAGLTESRAETADPRAMDVDPVPVSRRTLQRRKEYGMDIALNPGMAAPPSRSHRGLFALVALTLVGMLVASGPLWYGQPPSGDNGNELAWAPGPGTQESPIPPESPIASPPVFDYGPEYACAAEPLTSDEVMDIVLNPMNGYEQRGHEYLFDSLKPRLAEKMQRPDTSNWETVSMSPVFGTDLSHQLEKFGNGFWNCLITGSAFQVWGMMDPELLQWTILRNFPVLRAENDIQAFVEEWGPQRYGLSGTEFFPIMIGLPPDQASRIVSSSDGAIRIGTPRGLEGQQTRIGVITMVPASGDNDLNYYELYVREHPDGSWTVSGIGVNPNLPRG